MSKVGNHIECQTGLDLSLNNSAYLPSNRDVFKHNVILQLGNGTEKRIPQVNLEFSLFSHSIY